MQARTVNIEVRAKKTYVKRDVLEEQSRGVQDELDRAKAEEEADTKVNPSTGLTKAQSRDLLGMDE